MAAPDRTQIDDLIGALEADPAAFGFFQALRLIESAVPDAPGFGRSRRARQDPVRLGQQPYLNFAPSTLNGVDPGHASRPPRLYQNFHGLFGPNGPLPIHLTEYALERQRSWHDPTFARFCDIFHHRMLSLFYRVWADAEPAVCEDRSGGNRFDKYIGALAGFALPSQDQRDAMPDPARRFHAGHMARQTRNAEGLLGMLTQFFDVPVALEEYQPEWLELPAESRLLLARSRQTGCLGVNTVIGERSFERQYRFALVLGPMTREQYENLLPGEASARRLSAIVRNYAGLEYSWEYRMYLPEAERRTTQLGQYGALGHSTWLDGGGDRDCLISFAPGSPFHPGQGVNQDGGDFSSRIV